jgi:hypothetical protein
MTADKMTADKITVNEMIFRQNNFVKMNLWI